MCVYRFPNVHTVKVIDRVRKKESGRRTDRQTDTQAQWVASDSDIEVERYMRAVTFSLCII